MLSRSSLCRLATLPRVCRLTLDICSQAIRAPWLSIITSDLARSTDIASNCESLAFFVVVLHRIQSDKPCGGGNGNVWEECAESIGTCLGTQIALEGQGRNGRRKSTLNLPRCLPQEFFGNCRILWPEKFLNCLVQQPGLSQEKSIARCWPMRLRVTALPRLWVSIPVSIKMDRKTTFPSIK